MGADFRFACAEGGFDCAGDGGDKYWNLKKTEFVKMLQKIFYLSYQKFAIDGDWNAAINIRKEV